MSIQEIRLLPIRKALRIVREELSRYSENISEEERSRYEELYLLRQELHWQIDEMGE